MKIKVKKIITCLILVFLFSLMKCDCGNRIFWWIDIANNLSEPIYATVIFGSKSRSELGPILPEEIARKLITYISKTTSPEAHREIRRISVFSENREPLMVLQGKGMDEYVIFMGEVYGDDYLFRLEVTEDLIGIGLDDLNKRIDLEDELEDDKDSME